MTITRPVPVDCLGAMIDASYRLYVVCDTHGCGKTSEANLTALGARYGRNQGIRHDDLKTLPWRCTACGQRRVTFRLSPNRDRVTTPDPDEAF